MPVERRVHPKVGKKGTRVGITVSPFASRTTTSHKCWPVAQMHIRFELLFRRWTGLDTAKESLLLCDLVIRGPMTTVLDTMTSSHPGGPST